MSGKSCLNKPSPKALKPFTPLDKARIVGRKVFSGVGGNSLTGFTLIEMVVVLTIFSIIAAGVGLSFTSGLNLWNRAQNVDFVYKDTLLTLESILGEFRQIVETPWAKLEGEDDWISFPVLKRNNLIKVIYAFKFSKKEVVRKELSLEEMIEEKDESQVRGEGVASVDKFSLSYLYFDKEEGDYLWKDAWGVDEEEGGGYLAVKISVEAAGQKISKVVFNRLRETALE